MSVEMGHDDIVSSKGWLKSFKNRNGIAGAVLRGGAADVLKEVVEDWMKRLPKICAGYEVKDLDIFNADYRTLPNRSLVVKGDTCKGQRW